MIAGRVDIRRIAAFCRSLCSIPGNLIPRINVFVKIARIHLTIKGYIAASTIRFARIDFRTGTRISICCGNRTNSGISMKDDAAAIRCDCARADTTDIGSCTFLRAKRDAAAMGIDVLHQRDGCIIVSIIARAIDQIYIQRTAFCIDDCSCTARGTVQVDVTRCLHGQRCSPACQTRFDIGIDIDIASLRTVPRFFIIRFDRHIAAICQRLIECLH